MGGKADATAQSPNLNGVEPLDLLNGAKRVRQGGEAGDVVPLGDVVATGVVGGGTEVEHALGDARAAALAGGAAGLGVLDGDGRLGGGRRR